MVMNSVFIGLVSHAKTSFPQSHERGGLAATLSRAFGQLGIECSIHVNNRNMFDEYPFPLTVEMSRESVWQEIRLEAKWSEFLERRHNFRQFVRLTARRARFFLDWKKNSKDLELRRLLNIEYSHVDLYRRAVKSEAEWALILEDDAESMDINDLVSGLVSLTESNSNAKLINLSASFTLDQIGVRHLLSLIEGLSWSGGATREVLGSRKPATNTVCAIAFRTDFLAQVLADFDSQPAFPVLPIDWKLNETLMRMYGTGEIGANECLFIEPAPIVQLSMIRDREAK